MSLNNSRADIPNYVVINSGSQRFDIYSGKFDKNDRLTATPFTDTFFYIPGVPLSAALQTVQALNQNGASNRRSLEKDEQLYGLGDVRATYMEWLSEMDRRYAQLGRRNEYVTDALNLGYVTTDVSPSTFSLPFIILIPAQSCPGVGDDTLHIPLPFYDVPDFIASNPPNVSNDTLIDFVFVDFIEAQLLETLNTVQTDKVYQTSDVSTYSAVELNEIMGLYAQYAWN